MSSPPPGDPEAPLPPSSGPRVSGADVKDLGRLRRSTTDRKVAGVAGGIARHLDIDPVIVRIAFVVLVLFGGGGLLLYGACWLVVPEEDSDQAVLNLDGRMRAGIVVAAGVLAALAVAGDSVGGFGFPWPFAVVAAALLVYLAVRHGTPDPGRADDGTASHVEPLPAPRPSDPRRRGPVWFWFTLGLSALAAGVVLALQLAGVVLPHATYGAVVVAACGLMLVVGAFYGRSGGLVPLGLVAALVTLALSLAAAFPERMVSAGQTVVTPDRLSQLDEEYAVGFGEIRLDLSETRLDADHELDLDVGLGHIQVLVPEDGLTVEVDADIGLGEIKVFDDRYSDRAEILRVGEDDDPVLSVTADGRIGQIEIITSEDLR